MSCTSSVVSNASLTAEIVNPVIQSTIETFDMMLGAQVTRKSLELKTDETKFNAITAIIGLSGRVAGSICLSFPKETAFAAVKGMLDMDVTEVDCIVRDTVGEFANVIAGSAKDRLADMDLELGIPNIVRGDDHTVDFPANSQPMCITFDSNLGDFMIVFGFVNK